jgi:hypothetical protein
MRKAVTKALRERGFFAGAFDNEACWPGTPDVHYHRRGLGGVLEVGWIELKHLDADDLPKRADTPVRVPKYRPGQRLWHLDANKRGVTCHVLLVVDQEWLFFPAFWAAHHLGNVPLATLREAAIARWSGGFDLEKILPCL